MYTLRGSGAVDEQFSILNRASLSSIETIDMQKFAADELKVLLEKYKLTVIRSHVPLSRRPVGSRMKCDLRMMPMVVTRKDAAMKRTYSYIDTDERRKIALRHMAGLTVGVIADGAAGSQSSCATTIARCAG